MKYSIIFAIFLTFIFNHSSIAQVANDDCDSAFNLDSLWVNSNTMINCWNGIPVDTLINDSNMLAIVNFPYPSFPYSCVGYTPAPGLPANDMWYKIDYVGGCDLNLIISNTDTMHFVVWFGDSCNSLAPASCHTLLPGDTLITLSGNSYTGTYFQVSGNGPNKFTEFNICIWATAVCIPTYFSGAPTPFVCMNYNVNVTDASAITAADGSISIVINDGNPPYSIQWADGGVGFTRSNLSSGFYPYTTLDSVGCVTIDTVFVDVLSSIQDINSMSVDFNAFSNDNILTIDIENLIDTALIEIIDIYGQRKFSKIVNDSDNIIIENLIPGIYIVSLETKYVHEIRKVRLIR